MHIALHDSEYNGYPNLALMKLSAFHKALGDTTTLFKPNQTYDKVYSAKIFTWTEESKHLPVDCIKGGTGYDISSHLPDEVNKLCPDYSLYHCSKSYGFLTRGCPNHCSWCFVPEKEGNIRPESDITDFAQHPEVILMDNNVLAHEHGIQQIEKIIKLGLKIDFNQGLDARLIDDSIAKLLGKVKWLNPLRLACDTSAQMDHVYKAVQLLRWHNCTPSRYFCYVLVKDVEDALERVRFLKGIYVDPFAQPYRDKSGAPASLAQRRFARWVNHKAIFKSVLWEDYQKKYQTEEE